MRFLAAAAASLLLLPQVRPAPDVPFVPTPAAIVDAMLRLAGVTASDVVYDLGCGDGRILIAAARQYGAHGVGVDVDPRRIAEAQANAAAAGVADKVTFRIENLFETDVRPASVVALYLLPSVNAELAPRLKAQLRPGSRVVSNSFDMGEAWPFDVRQPIDGTAIFLWRVK